MTAIMAGMVPPPPHTMPPVLPMFQDADPKTVAPKFVSCVSDGTINGYQSAFPPPPPPPPPRTPSVLPATPPCSPNDVLDSGPASVRASIPDVVV
jgi:hypothetical protein